MINQFNHRYANFNFLTGEFEISGKEQLSSFEFKLTPKYYIEEKEAVNKYNLSDWLIGIRRIARSTDERTIISCLLPKSCPSYSLNTLKFKSPKESLFYLANFNSFALDYLSRQKLGGANVTWVFTKQLPLIDLKSVDNNLFNFIVNCTFELVYTSNDLKNFASDYGYKGLPFKWDKDRRLQIINILNAIFFSSIWLF